MTTRIDARAPVAVVKGGVVPEEMWRCLPCGTVNPTGWPFCDACGSPQPGPTRWQSPDDPETEDLGIVSIPPPSRAAIRPRYIPASAPRSRRVGYLLGALIGIMLIAVGCLAIAASLNQPSGTIFDSLPPAAHPEPIFGQTVTATPSGSPVSGSPSADPKPSSSTSPSGSASSPSSSPSSVPPSVTPSHTPPTPTPTLFVGLVDVRAVTTNPHVLTVGGLFDSYFAGINAKAYPRVLALYDPTGALNTNDPNQAATFTRGISTTTDSRVVLWSISDDPAHAGDLNARITFQSEQQRGYGPAGTPNETCTVWDNTYQLSPTRGGYRILNLPRFTHHPC